MVKWVPEMSLGRQGGNKMAWHPPYNAMIWYM